MRENPTYSAFSIVSKWQDVVSRIWYGVDSESNLYSLVPTPNQPLGGHWSLVKDIHEKVKVLSRRVRELVDKAAAMEASFDFSRGRP